MTDHQMLLETDEETGESFPVCPDCAEDWPCVYARLEVVRRCAHDRLADIAGETATYDEAFRKLCIANAALTFIEQHARGN